MAIAGRASSLLGIETKGTWRETASFGFWQFGEQVANIVKEFDVSCGVATRCSTDRALVDIDDFVEMFNSVNRIVSAWRILGSLKRIAQGWR